MIRTANDVARQGIPWEVSDHAPVDLAGEREALAPGDRARLCAMLEPDQPDAPHPDPTPIEPD